MESSGFNCRGSDAVPVLEKNNSQAAQDLGLIPAGQTTSSPAVTSGGAEIITGSDANPGETQSVFNAVIRLRRRIAGRRSAGH